MDIRFPIGGLLALIGLMIAAHSFTLSDQQLAKSLGTNVNLYWGSVLVVVGGVFLTASRRGKA